MPFSGGIFYPILRHRFFPLIKGPKQPRPATLQCKGRIIELRKQNYSINEIEEVLLREGVSKQAEGFAKPFRRTHAEKRAALQMT